ncbi:substrate-binding domain-containing protein, partial [Streptomyces hyaluromycini]
LDLAEPPDAVFCFADAMAEGALAVARERGLSVPGDVAVVGFDDVEAARYTAPALTTVAPDKRELARVAVRALLRRIEGAADREPTVLTVGHRLVVRDSG